MSRNFTAEVVLDSAKARKGMSDLTQQARTLNSAMTTLATTLRTTQGNLTKTAASMEAISRAAKTAAVAMDTTAKSRINASRAQVQADNAAIKSQDLLNRKALEAQRNASATASNSRASYTDGRESRAAELFAQRQAQAARSTDALGNSLSNTRYLLYDVGATYRTIALSLAALPAASTAVATAYEKSFAQVLRTTGLFATGSASQIAELRGNLKQMATEIPLSFAELGNIAMIGGQMNIANEDLTAFTETVARFVATADGMNIESATQMFGRLQNLFNTSPSGGALDPEFFNKIGSAISKTADNSVTSEKAISAMLSKMSAVGAQAGMSAQDVVALASALTSVGIQPELGSGMVTRFFGGLNVAVADGSGKLDAFAKYLGVTRGEVESLIRTDPQELFQQMLGAIESMNSVDAAKALNEMGVTATRDIRVVNALASQMHVYKQSIEDVNGAYASGDYLKDTSEAIFGTFSANLQKLGSAFANLGDSLGSAFLPQLSQIASVLTTGTQALSSFLDNTPAIRFMASTVLTLVTAWAGIFALKSVFAFVGASLTGFQHAIQSGVSGATTMGGSMKQLATTMLVSKGYTQQQSAAMLAGASSMRAMQIATTQTTADLATYNVATRTATVSGGGFASSLGVIGKGLLGAVGGPAGLAVMGIAAIGTAWIQSGQNAQQGAKQVVDAFEESAESGAKALAEKINSTGLDLWRYGGNVGDWGRTLGDAMEHAGVGVDTMAKAMSGGIDTAKAFRDKMNEAKVAAYASEGSDSQLAAEYRYIAIYMDDYIAAQEKLNATKADATEINNKLGISETGAGEAINETAGAAEDAADPLEKFASALDKAIQGVFGLSNARGALTNAMSGLGESIASNGTGFDVNTTSGADNLSKLQATLQAQAQVLQQALQAGEIGGQQAAARYSEFVQGLMSQLASMGVDTTQIKAQADEAVNAFAGAIAQGQAEGAFDAVVGIDYSDAEGTINQFMTGAANMFNSSELRAIIGADTTLADQEVYNLFAYIVANTNMDYQAIITALTDPAGKDAQALAQYLQQIINGGNYKAAISADTSAGAANVYSFVSYAQNLLNQVQGNIDAVASNAQNFNSDGTPFTKGQQAEADRYSGQAKRYAAQQQMNSIVAKGYTDTQAKAVPAYQSLGNAMQSGYNKGQKAAEKATGSTNKGTKAAKAKESAEKKASDAAVKAIDRQIKANDKLIDKAQKVLDKLKDWDAAYKAIAEYAGRVGTAFGYVQTQTQGVQVAMDAYNSAVNEAKQRLDAAKQSIKDLRAENKKLQAENKVDKGEAANYDRLANLATMTGDSKAAAQFKAQADELREGIKVKEDQIAANKKEASSLEKGIGNLKGYTDAAIKNREELRNLQDLSLAVAEAYAAAGGSATTVRKKTEEWTKKAKEHSRQLGYNRVDIEKVMGSTKDYIKILDKVPTRIEVNIAEKRVTTLQARDETLNATKSAKANINGVPGSKNANLGASNNTGGGVSAAKRGIAGVPGSKTTALKAKADNNSIKEAFNKIPNSKTVKLALKPGYAPGYAGAITYVAPGGKQQPGGKLVVNNRGGYIGTDQRMSGYASGGLIPGKSPANPREDNLMARVDGQGLVGIRSGEYVMRQESVDYYGKSFMSKLNQMQLPRYNMGGMIGNAGRVETNSGVVDLSAETIMAIARAMPEVALYADSQEIARSVDKGNRQLLARGMKLG